MVSFLLLHTASLSVPRTQEEQDEAVRGGPGLGLCRYLLHQASRRTSPGPSSSALSFCLHTASVRCQKDVISVQPRPNGIQILCGGTRTIDGEKGLDLTSEDDSSGEYTCSASDGDVQKIYVKFRSESKAKA